MPKRIFSIVLLISTAFLAYMVSYSLYISQVTGRLYVTSSKNALITISQDNHQAKIIGVSGAKIVLKPGNYQLSAVYGTKQKFMTVSIKAKHRVNTVLIPVSPVSLPSPQNIQFLGTDSLLNNGLTSAQLSDLRQAVFDFKQSAGTVNIDSSTVQSGPHSLGEDFTLNFNVAIDGISYKASIDYSSPDALTLYLYDRANNSLVFNSGSISD